MKQPARVIAFYLPQFHPIPENDRWWGKGFTEWTNVGKAKPLFRGHDQPRIPADLGYYDLRVPEIRSAQAELAQKAGIEGFAYWHYWWAGKTLLEKPLNTMLESRMPDFPFCLSWANESWSGIWHGNPAHILMEQTYPGIDDHVKHFEAILPALLDSRYITLDNKPIFLIYKPFDIPNVEQFLNCWQKLAQANGLPGIHFIAITNSPNDIKTLIKKGFDGVNINRFGIACQLSIGAWRSRLRWHTSRFTNRFNLNTYEYKDILPALVGPESTSDMTYPTLLPNWDNSPRSQCRAMIVTDSTPELFLKLCDNVFRTIKPKSLKNRLVFLKSWNEWAEGNYMEPDIRFGHGYLDALRKSLDKIQQK